MAFLGGLSSFNEKTRKIESKGFRSGDLWLIPFTMNVMIKYAFLLGSVWFTLIAQAQEETRISSIDFVQVLNGHHEEALYYYQHNWRWLRELAMEKGYIVDYEFYRVERTETTPYDLILITVYRDKVQSDAREDHFAELIELKGDLRLLNEKQPSDFRKLLAGHEKALHLQKK